MTTPAVSAKRITRTYRQIINASPDEVFPLLCPVREAEWLDGWQYTMRYSQSGVVEEGAVFTTPGQGEPETVWIVTRHDPAQRVVEFTRFTPDSRVCVLRIHVTSNEPGRSFVDIAYTYTALTPLGDAFIEQFTEEPFRQAVRFWEQSMNHWLEKGARLTRAAAQDVDGVD